MRNIGQTAKWLVSLTAMLCLAGCDTRRIVGVERMPGDDLIETVINECVELRVKRLAFARLYSDGKVETYYIDTVASARRVCQ